MALVLWFLQRRLMKKTILASLLFSMTALAQSPKNSRDKGISVAWDVPAVSYVTPPSHPCNVSTDNGSGISLAVCITENETHWKCADASRVLLKSEDGNRHCILFPEQQPEVVSVGRK